MSGTGPGVGGTAYDAGGTAYDAGGTAYEAGGTAYEAGAASFDALWADLAAIGRDPGTGGYHRLAFTPAELGARDWFAAAAGERALVVHTDRDTNLWAWWVGPWGGPDDPDALVLGSHLDSVIDGGGYDGGLGVASAFAALDAVRAAGLTPTRPVAVAAFAEEEGARFGVACAGSRLLTGALEPGLARGLRDRAGVSLAEAMAAAGFDPDRLGPDPDRLGRIGDYVELHIEQGRGLVDLGAPVGVADRIWPHGRYRLDFSGEANHAGTTEMSDRHDPMLTFAMTVLAANKQARLAGSRATIGRVQVEPNGTNAVPSRVRAWLDARAADEARLGELVEVVARQAGERAERDGTGFALTPESVTAAVDFDRGLRDRLVAAVGRAVGRAVGGAGSGAGSGAAVGGAAVGGAGSGAAAARVARPGGVPVLPTGAGHDAGILASAGVRAGMIFVRNPTGVSHSPGEHAETADCHRGVAALAAVIEDLAC